MATSNSYNYTIDRDTLIRTAFENIGVGVEGESLDAEDITVAARALNMMIKSWVAYGLNVWKRKHYTLSLTASKRYYDLGTPETDSITVVGDGTTAVTVTHPYHGYKTGDSVVIAGATDDTDINGTFTITVTNPSTYTYTALAAVDSGTETGSTTATLVASLDIPRPERILSFDRVDSSNISTEMTSMSLDEYEALSDKTTTGTPVNYYYERNIGAGRVYLWPVPDSSAASDYTCDIVYQAQIEDLDSSTDDLDFPQEWMEAVSLGLSARLAPKYGYPLQERMLLYRAAEDALELALGHDNEDTSVFFIPNLER